jgi:excisionase family DNA binding protein
MGGWGGVSGIQAQAPYGVRQVARLLGVSRFTVYALIKRGELPAYRVGNRLRVDAQGLARFKQASQAGGQSWAARPGPASAPRVPGPWLEVIGEDGQPCLVGLPALRAFGPTTIAATRLCTQTFSQHRYTGVLLHTLLLNRGVLQPVERWRAVLSRFILAVGADGHRVALTVGEIDPAYSNVPVLIAWERDGAPLSPDEGPLLLVVPSDHRGGRYVRQLTRLIVGDGAAAVTPVLANRRDPGPAGDAVDLPS